MDKSNPESNFAFLPNDLLIRCVTSNHVVKDESEKSYISTAIWQPRYRANKNGENVNIDKEGLSLLLHRLITPSCSETSCRSSEIKCHCSCKHVEKYSDCSVYLNYRNAMSNDGVSFKLTPNKKNPAHTSLCADFDNVESWSIISFELYYQHEWYIPSDSIALRENL
ncbi:MAG: hypothetical protein ORN98_05765 [Alphaproteobacteria bacterium]|nr:hypothetical protein [Alphaproteobacteria bacterium]